VGTINDNIYNLDLKNDIPHGYEIVLRIKWISICIKNEVKNDS